MHYKLIIKGRLPGLNEFYGNTLTNRNQGNRLKHKTEDIIGDAIFENGLYRVRITKPVWMHYSWYEAEKRRDLDNISSFGRKCIQDALVKNNILLNDGWKNIKGFSDSFYIDKQNPRIEVDIIEIENENFFDGFSLANLIINFLMKGEQTNA